jgi:zinc protease
MITRHLFSLVLSLALVGFTGVAKETAANASVVSHPQQLSFPPLDYQPPNPADYRVQLKSGPVAYVVPDRELPLVNISILVRTGDYVEPAGKEGVAGLTGNLLTRG